MRRPDSAPGEARLALDLAPFLLAAVLGLVPFTVFSTFLVPIGDAVGREPVGLGGLRGLGGAAAAVVGVGFAPLVDRFAKGASVAVAMVLLAAGSAALALGTYAAIVVCCVLVGAGTAVLTPTLVAGASDRYADPATSGRAATLVTATTTLTAVAAGPALGGAALLMGWRGVAWTTTGLAVAAAIAFALRVRANPAPTPARDSWLDTIGAVLRRSDLVALILVAALRTAAFMGTLSVVAVLYSERFSLSAEQFTLVWTVSGLSFALANAGGGRLLAGRTSPGTVLYAGLALALVATGVLFTAPSLWVAVSGTSGLAVGHALVAAVVTTVVVRTSGDLRGGTLGFQGVAMSVGTLGGAALAAAAYAVAGWAGTGAAVAAVTMVTGIAGLVVFRRPAQTT